MEPVQAKGEYSNPSRNRHHCEVGENPIALSQRRIRYILYKILNRKCTFTRPRRPGYCLPIEGENHMIV